MRRAFKCEICDHLFISIEKSRRPIMMATWPYGIGCSNFGSNFGTKPLMKVKGKEQFWGEIPINEWGEQTTTLRRVFGV